MRRYLPEIALVGAAFLFGSTFELVQDALDDVTPFGYLLVRFTVGVLALAPFVLARLVRSDREYSRLLARSGLVAGLLLFVGYAFQTVGLEHTTSSSSAFITGLYVIFTPLVEAVLRRRLPPTATIAGIAIATFGLFLLTGATLSWNLGDVLTLGCAVTFAIWIVYQQGYLERLGPLPFTSVQMAVVAGVSLPVSGLAGFGTPTAFALFAAIFTGVACSAIALSLQLWGQQRVGPSRTALILLMEPIFAGIVGFLAGERLGPLRLTGAAVIMAGITVAELASVRARADVAATSGTAGE